MQRVGQRRGWSESARQGAERDEVSASGSGLQISLTTGLRLEREVPALHK